MDRDDGADCLPLADWVGDADGDTKATAEAVKAGAEQIITAIRTVAHELRSGQKAEAARAQVREAPAPVTVVAPPLPRLPWRAVPVRDADTGLILYIDILPIEEADL